MSKGSAVHFVGPPCGQHGQYKFFKALRFTGKEGRPRALYLGEFFFVRISSNEDPCIGELQLLWEDRSTRHFLSSVRLYFLPEQTPDGRQASHGEHEVLAASEKVILRLHDLVSWVTEEVDWVTGLELPVGRPQTSLSAMPFTSIINTRNNVFKPMSSELELPHDIEEKGKNGNCLDGPSVLVLSYPRYCRYRALLKRFEGKENEMTNKENTQTAVNSMKSTDSSSSSGACPANWPKSAEELATSLLSNSRAIAPHSGDREIAGSARVVFCRETFEHEGLLHHDLNCDHLAPKLKGRPRKRGIKSNSNNSQRSSSPDSSDENKPNESSKLRSTRKKSLKTKNGNIPVNGSHCTLPLNELKGGAKSLSTKLVDKCLKNESEFLKQLYKFMKERNSPIQRIPHLGFKKIDLYYLYTYAQKLGGYDKITCNKMWKRVYDELGGDPRSTSAATCTRRHYERLLLPFERYMKGICTDQKKQRVCPKRATNTSKPGKVSEETKVPKKRGRKPKYLKELENAGHSTEHSQPNESDEGDGEHRRMSSNTEDEEVTKSLVKVEPVSDSEQTREDSDCDIKPEPTLSARAAETADEVASNVKHESQSAPEGSRDGDIESNRETVSRVVPNLVGEKVGDAEVDDAEVEEGAEEGEEEELKHVQVEKETVMKKEEESSGRVKSEGSRSECSLNGNGNSNSGNNCDTGSEPSEPEPQPARAVKSESRSLPTTPPLMSISSLVESMKMAQPSSGQPLISKTMPINSTPTQILTANFCLSMSVATAVTSTTLSASNSRSSIVSSPDPSNKVSCSVSDRPSVIQRADSFNLLLNSRSFPMQSLTQPTLSLFKKENVCTKPPSAHSSSRSSISPCLSTMKRRFEGLDATSSGGEILDLSVKKRLSEADSRTSPSKALSGEHDHNILDLTLKSSKKPFPGPFPLEGSGHHPVKGRHCSPSPGYIPASVQNKVPKTPFEALPQPQNRLKYHQHQHQHHPQHPHQHHHQHHQQRQFQHQSQPHLLTAKPKPSLIPISSPAPSHPAQPPPLPPASSLPPPQPPPQPKSVPKSLNVVSSASLVNDPMTQYMMNSMRGTPKGSHSHSGSGSGAMSNYVTVDGHKPSISLASPLVSASSYSDTSRFHRYEQQQHVNQLLQVSQAMSAGFSPNIMAYTHAGYMPAISDYNPTLPLFHLPFMASPYVPTSAPSTPRIPSSSVQSSGHMPNGANYRGVNPGLNAYPPVHSVSVESVNANMAAYKKLIGQKSYLFPYYAK